jgi:hypothetical protein
MSMGAGAVQGAGKILKFVSNLIFIYGAHLE